jgi:hypothetical protein
LNRQTTAKSYSTACNLESDWNNDQYGISLNHYRTSVSKCPATPSVQRILCSHPISHLLEMMDVNVACGSLNSDQNSVRRNGPMRTFHGIHGAGWPTV